MIKPHPPINELAIVTALSQQMLAQTGINAFPLEMGAMQGKRTVFSTRRKAVAHSEPTKAFPKRSPEMAMLFASFSCISPYPAFLLKHTSCNDLIGDRL